VKEPALSLGRFATLGLSVGFIAVGSTLAFAAETTKTAPTYHKDVERIIQKNCQDCHRPGQVAPFSLLTYEQAKKRSNDLANVATDRRMPPWPADHKFGGPFRDARVLSNDDLKTIQDWVANGSPEGDKADAPPARTFSSEWPLGNPDLLLTMPEPYELAASGEDDFRVFVLKTNFNEDRWIRAVDFKPGNRAVVHHILAGIDSSGEGRKLDAADPKPGYHALGGFGGSVRVRNLLPIWTPGAMARFTNAETGYFLPKGADILIQMHYHKSGKPEKDASSVAIYFSKEPLSKEIRTGFVFPNISKEQAEAVQRKMMLQSLLKRQRPTFDDFLRDILIIPAQTTNYEIKASTKSGSSVMGRPFARDVMITAVMPHMHWLGRNFTFHAVKPDGSKIELIRINNWDFNWQGTYAFEKPVILPKGSWLEMEAHFDNSDKNPSNQNKPAKEVRWGEGTNDEMCIGIFEFVFLENAKPGDATRKVAGR
jgi:hypothetical protein